jgi:alpha-amylase
MGNKGGKCGRGDGVDDKVGSGCAVLLTNGDEDFKTIEIGKRFAGKVFVDHLGKHPAEFTIYEDGWGEFHVKPGSVSVRVEKK